MTRVRGRARAAAGWVAVVLVALLGGSCARAESPEEVARAYARSLYAGDAEALWPLISAQDRRVKTAEAFRQQEPSVEGFARAAAHQLAGYIVATPVKTTVAGDRATVTLRLSLPDANAAEIRALLHDWDEAELNGLSAAERSRITARLSELHAAGTLPVVEGEQTLELVREGRAWRLLLGWAGGVRVRFAADVDPSVPLDVQVTPAEAVLMPGDRLRVTVRAVNATARAVTTRVGHRIEPEADARHLALLLCPLFVPVTVEPGEAREWVSHYALLADAPTELGSLGVTYLVRNGKEISHRPGLRTTVSSRSMTPSERQ